MRITLQLTATGRRSGEPREVELFAFPDGDRLVVVGSRGGSPRDPLWADNLRANPRAVIRRGRTVEGVHATEVSGLDRERLWAMVSEAFPTYLYYQRKTKRPIPLFVLDAVDGADLGGPVPELRRP